MFLRLVLTALIAGLVGGIAVSALQAIGTTPLILQAETFEAGAHADTHGWERLGFTLLANILMATGYAALLAAAFTLLGRDVSLTRSAGWGIAGFAAFGFIPAIGLPPELPGMVAAEIAPRQLWWWSSASPWPPW